MLWLIIIIVLLVFLILWGSWSKELAYDKINSEASTQNVKRFMNLTKLKPIKNSMDYYRLGCVYDYIYKSPQIASRYYKAAASKIDIEMPTRADRFILNKLADRIDLDFYLEIDEEPIMDYFRSSDVPIAKRLKTKVEDHITWEKDNNNAHDTNINSEIVEKIGRIRTRTHEPYSIEKVEECIRNLSMPDFEIANKEPAMKTVQHIKEHNQCLYKAEMYEMDMLGYIVADIKTNYTADRQQTLMENLVNNLKDAAADGNVVCINGRMSRMLNAYTDGEEETFKTIEIWKNDLLEAASRSKSKYLDALDEEAKKIYDKDQPGEELDKINKDILAVMKEAISNPAAPPKVISLLYEEIEYCV